MCFTKSLSQSFFLNSKENPCDGDLVMVNVRDHESNCTEQSLIVTVLLLI